MNNTNELPTGSKFLPGTSTNYLRECQESETDPKASQRLLACILRKDGKSIREIGGILNRRYSTVRGWLVRISEEGIRGRFDRERPGGICKLSDDQIAVLKKDLREGPQAHGFSAHAWSGKMVAKHMEKSLVSSIACAGHCTCCIGFIFRGESHVLSIQKQPQKR